MSTVMIVGATRGIGLELTKQYAKEGNTVIACARDLSAASQLDELSAGSDNIRIEELDIAESSSIDSAASRIGKAAIDSIIKLLSPGDEIISTNDLYGGTYRLFTKIFENYGIKFHFINMKDLDSIPNLINKKTKMIWAETPTNPMLNIVDIKSLSSISKKYNLIFVVDNTFATPFLQ